MKYLSILLALVGVILMTDTKAQEGRGDRVTGKPYASRSVVLSTNGMALEFPE